VARFLHLASGQKLAIGNWKLEIFRGFRMKPKLLVLELWGLGDLAIATPFLQAAAQKYAVTLLAKPFAEELRLRFWPEIEVIPFAAPWTAFRAKYQLWHWPWRDLLRLRRRLAAARFDYGVSARWDPRDHLALKLSGATERFGFSRLKSRRYLTRELPRPDPLAHRYEYWRVAGAALGLQLPARTELFLTPAGRPPVVLIHTGARLPLRVWPLERFQELAARLRQKKFIVHIACDPDQSAWWAAHGETAVCPRNVTELLAVLSAAGVFIGNDSGPGHLAAACDRPTFTLFGPQLHEWFAPLHPASEVVEGRACPYKPCSDYCRFAEAFCLRGVTLAEVWPGVEAFVIKHLR
jgi:ADP-heptose:LPS heptosyltransferase